MSALDRLDDGDVPGTSEVAYSGTQLAGITVLRRRSSRWALWRILPFLGPAFVASVAYVDPGNFATNISAGAQFGYNLLWVVLASNLIAMLVQYLAAKLGIATGQNLPETIRTHWPRWLSLFLWVGAEVAAMATDLAEFVGATLGFNLLFHVPLLLGALLTGLTTFAILGLQRLGVRPVEAVVGSLVGVIALCYIVETFLDKPDWKQVGFHAVTPFVSSSSILVSVGILGATVMPHVVYLHSALTQRRIPTRTIREKRRLLRFNTVDVVIAMAIAGLVNMAMLYMAASTFHFRGLTHVSDIRTAYQTLQPLLGSGASTIFGLSLLASGIASSAVGTLAGQVIMGGFVGWTIPVWIRRVVTMLPALIVIGMSVSTTQALIISQVVLSLVLPFALIPLVWFTARSSVMGPLVNRMRTTVAAGICAGLVIALNAALLYTTVGGHF